MSSNMETWLNRREFIQASAASISVPLIPGCAIGGSRPREHGAVQLGRNQPFDLGWKFFKSSDEGFEASGLDDSAWRTLDLPHDWSIEDLPTEEGTERIGPFDKKSAGGTATGFTVGGEGWYRRHFRMERMPAEGRVEVLFEGVYMESDVWLNGRHLGSRVHGYTPFAFDLTRGFNAIRSSHNPTSRAFADAYDRHGMLLIEEAFDMWRWPKNPQDYSTHFDENWKADLTAMVLSARNHPSVIMWSIGNEIPNLSTPKCVEIEWNLANEVHRLDPSRPVTAAVNSFAGRPLVADEATARRGFAGIPDESAAMFLDVVGYNYKLDRYEADHVQFPKRVMFGSESFPKQLLDIWSFVDTHPYVIGDFVWAAMDYLGEAGIGNALRTKHKAEMMFPGWPWTVSNCGDLDLTGLPKPQSYARDVAWGVGPLEMAVQRPLPEDLFEIPGLWGWSDECQSWSWPGAEGKPLAVRIYARADRVELRLNGQVVHSHTLSGTDKLPLEFRVPYAPGALQAIAYRDGKEIGRREFNTVGEPVAVRLTPERPAGNGRQNSLSYIRVEVIDAQGRVVPDSVRRIQLTAIGPATLIGLGNGGALAKGSFQLTDAETHDGRALAIMKSHGQSGLVIVEARCEGLQPGSARLRLT